MSKPDKLVIFQRMRRYLGVLASRPIFAVLLLGGAARLIFLLSYISSPEWEQLLVDSLFHDRWALSIASGNIIGQEAFFRAPFYIYLLGGLYALFGHSLLAARIFGHLVGLLSVYITCRLALRLFSKKTAVIAGIIHALYPIAIYFESELLVDSLFMTLVELSILVFFVARDKNRSKWYLLTGLILGVAAITRPIILALLPLYILWLFLSRLPLRKAISHGLILLTATLLVILPITLRNIMVADDFVLISSSGGINFYIGNNASADGLSASMPPPLGSSWEMKDIRYVAEKESGRELRASQVSYFWLGKGLDWMIVNKIDFLKLYVKKLYFFINNFENSNNRNLAQFFNVFPVLKVIPLSFGLIFSLAIISVLLIAAQKGFNRQILFIIIFITLYSLILSFFFVNARFRLPIMPYIIILSSYSISFLVSEFYNKRIRLISVLAISAGAGVLVLSNTNFYDIDKDYAVSGYYNKGNYYLYTSELERAISFYQLVLKSDSRYPEANMNLGAAYLKKGLGDSAEFYFKRELESHPFNAKAYSNLASLYYLREAYNQSKRFAQKAIELKPYFADPYIISLRVSAALGDTLAIENRIMQARENLGDNAGLFLDAGVIYSDWKMYDKAVKYLTASLESIDLPIETDDRAFNYARLKDDSINRTKARAAYQLGYIYGMQNKMELSIRMSSLAISLDSNLAEAYINLANGYLIMGEKDKARNLIQNARARFPENKVVQIMLERLN